MQERLTKAEWVAHGLKALTNGGIAAIKVGPLASGLGVSRGSFYWHFADIAEFRVHLLESWRTSSTDAVIVALADEAQTDRLAQLIKQAFEGDKRLETAIRAWSATDAGAAKVVTEVDRRRVGYIEELLRAAGLPAHQASTRARFIYWAYLGQAIASDEAASTPTSQAINDIAALFKR